MKGARKPKLRQYLWKKNTDLGVLADIARDAHGGLASYVLECAKRMDIRFIGETAERCENVPAFEPYRAADPGEEFGV